ncbi:MAG: STAS domain-containing protein [Phaeospirillum sp.]|nr:STAS domain-containing protein [Phaeospirillum sp.]
MDFQTQSTGADLRVMLHGRLTFNENSQFRLVLGRIADSAATKVVFDLGGVDFIDSAGLGMLLYARDTLRQRDGVVTLDAAIGQVDRMLDLARMRDLFKA